ncbi:magnesium chelatase family protein [Paraburkholderia strydomiana]|nr:magnesium chelatase family protein [Paraburkholderia strydomiana]
MSLAVVRSRAPASGRAPEVTVEVHLANGLPSFSIVGLPDLEVRESRERVRAALQNCGFDFPVRRITVNLAPADLPKESGRFDLPIALGILAASGQIPVESLLHREFAGELSLTGALRPMRGAFAMACGTARSAAAGDASAAECMATRAPPHCNPQLYLPAASAAEAALVPGVDVYGASDLPSLCAHLADAPEARLYPVAAPDLAQFTPVAVPDMGDVIGQRGARRALEVAAAGGHHVLLIGPPGAGKSMLAARLPGLLPPMTDDEALSSAALLSASRTGFSPSQWRRRPFRAPHHSSSAAALVGGRNPPQPGEITLAHLGVLFLDELPEFDRDVLETLREPLEAGRITISRAALQADFPAACQLIAAMNPCPCGWRGDPNGRCRCTPRHRGALPAQAVRAAARSHRHSTRSACAYVGGAFRAVKRRWRDERGYREPGERRTRASIGAARQNQPRVEWKRGGRRLPARRSRRSATARGRGALRLVGPRLLPRVEGGAHHRGPRRDEHAERCTGRRGRSVSTRFWLWVRRKICCQDLTYAHARVPDKFRNI